MSPEHVKGIHSERASPRALRRGLKALLATAAVLLLLLTGLILLSLSCMDCLCPPGFERNDRAKLDIHNIAGALKLYFAKHGRYPSTTEGLQPLIEQDLLERVPLDPWNNPYRYELRMGRVEVLSLGADNHPGGTGRDADIRLSELRPLHEDAGS